MHVPVLVQPQPRVLSQKAGTKIPRVLQPTGRSAKLMLAFYKITRYVNTIR